MISGKQREEVIPANLVGIMLKKYCEALKAVEFKHSSQNVTIMHQGRHNCQLKPDYKSQLQYAQEQTLNRDLEKSPRELKIDLIGYYLVQGYIEKAKEVAEKWMITGS